MSPLQPVQRLCHRNWGWEPNTLLKAFKLRRRDKEKPCLGETEAREPSSWRKGKCLALSLRYLRVIAEPSSRGGARPLDPRPGCKEPGQSLQRSWIYSKSYGKVQPSLHPLVSVCPNHVSMGTTYLLTEDFSIWVLNAQNPNNPSVEHKQKNSRFIAHLVPDD